MEWFLDDNDLIPINQANKAETYNNMFEVGWRLPSYDELYKAYKKKETIFTYAGYYATSDIEDGLYVVMFYSEKNQEPTKIFLKQDSKIPVRVKLCTDVKIEPKPKEEKKPVKETELNMENVKCCGNCMYHNYSGICCNPYKVNKFFKIPSKAVCFDWEFDGKSKLFVTEAGASRVSMFVENKPELDLSENEISFFKYIYKKGIKADA